MARPAVAYAFERRLTWCILAQIGGAARLRTYSSVPHPSRHAIGVAAGEPLSCGRGLPRRMACGAVFWPGAEAAHKLGVGCPRHHGADALRHRGHFRTRGLGDDVDFVAPGVR